jgi:hypothetical protein
MNPGAEYEPHFDADGNFIHPCCICGKQARFGFGVSMRNDKLGQWYCAQCKPPLRESTMTNYHARCPAPDTRGSSNSAERGEEIMDMTEYAGTAFIGYDDIRNGPRQETITDVTIGNYDKPVLAFESGAQFSLNKTNTRVLVRAYGKDSRDWVGCRIELFGGETEYQGQKTNSVLVRPISPEKAPAASKATPEPKQHRTGGIETGRRSSMSSEMDDDIAFAAEFR